jgi:hypothetical protein
MAQPNPIETGADDSDRTGVPQRAKPLRKWNGTALAIEADFNPDHALTVAYKLPDVNRAST